MTDKLTHLLPCPFCGCTKVPKRQGNGIGDYWLECFECGASIRLREDGAGMEKDWNRRPAPTQQPSVEVTHGNTTMDECMASLLDRLEMAEVYADRYRYLRERPLDAVSSGGVFAGKTPDNVVLNGADLDAAIDAARTQRGES
ncbi:Lar family restriction alleviation protein [Burkholderia pseudomallei]|uniref:Lar family restriction alleviation protein n=1 Tax=Burkholderia pseudomallei TaxID=28450 RepID=UPI000F20583D|nr:Lar family restriction alleviation protein [Burkholderia pseudomallei]CAJ9662373.1 restriction alleviation protein, Lar family [Burkholderia pseudomallei]CAJ9865253.1 restriction alleviation protein, Lar family [Burkholderia pseudomallei]VBD35116.1 restriction alleviation protein, Lar family [Burkholderia pseudomallei]